jgi:Zn finger protein HypA/HybF involved in hydrogenase expression
MRNDQHWRDYEQVATHLLNKLAVEFGLKRVEGKQRLVGATTGTEWDVDAKGIKENGDAFVIIECRDTAARQSQAKVAALAFQIHDTGADGGLIVSPLPLQEGAAKVARATNIISVQIDANSTPDDFAVRFVNKVFLGVSIRVTAKFDVRLTNSRQCSACGERFPAEAQEKVCPRCASLQINQAGHPPC